MGDLHLFAVFVSLRDLMYYYLIYMIYSVYTQINLDKPKIMSKTSEQMINTLLTRAVN